MLRKLGATYDHNPSRDVTKDGKAIYGHVEEKQLHVSIGDPAAGTERELFQTPMASEKGLALRVSPDEGRLALIADEGHTVSVMSMAGEDRREIYRVAPPYTIGNLRWYPNGQSMLLVVWPAIREKSALKCDYRREAAC